MSGSKIAVIVAALVVVAGAIVIVSLKVGGMGGGNDESPRERVRLEIRASEAAKIVMNGKPIGQTPLSIYVAKTNQPLTLEASMVEHWANRRGEMTEPERHMSKTIIPDHDQVVDFIPPKGPPPP